MDSPLFELAKRITRAHVALKALNPLTKDEIAQMELGMHLIVGDCPMPGFDRLCLTARIGAEFLAKTTAPSARFPHVFCSQCGEDFGPGEHGYSHCSDHRKVTA
jgi:hypothetical protein